MDTFWCHQRYLSPRFPLCWGQPDHLRHTIGHELLSFPCWRSQHETAGREKMHENKLIRVHTSTGQLTKQRGTCTACYTGDLHCNPILTFPRPRNACNNGAFICCYVMLTSKVSTKPGECYFLLALVGLKLNCHLMRSKVKIKDSSSGVLLTSQLFWCKGQGHTSIQNN